LKKQILVSLALAAAILSTACNPPSTMVKKTAPATVASIKPQAGKAALVISRTTSFGRAVNFRTYLDKAYIGSTVGKVYFAKTDIEPGTKHVISWGENGVAVKVNFEADKVYCIQQNVSMGFLKARVVVEAMNAKRLDSGDLAGCDYYEFDPANKTERDLSDEEFADVIKDADTLILKDDGTSELVPVKKN